MALLLYVLPVLYVTPFSPWCCVSMPWRRAAGPAASLGRHWTAHPCAGRLGTHTAAAPAAAAGRWGLCVQECALLPGGAAGGRPGLRPAAASVWPWLPVCRCSCANPDCLSSVQGCDWPVAAGPGCCLCCVPVAYVGNALRTTHVHASLCHVHRGACHTVKAVHLCCSLLLCWGVERHATWRGRQQSICGYFLTLVLRAVHSVGPG
jgi:hypothetical protein